MTRTSSQWMISSPLQQNILIAMLKLLVMKKLSHRFQEVVSLLLLYIFHHNTLLSDVAQQRSRNEVHPLPKSESSLPSSRNLNGKRPRTDSEPHEANLNKPLPRLKKKPRGSATGCGTSRGKTLNGRGSQTK